MLLFQISCRQEGVTVAAADADDCPSTLDEVTTDHLRSVSFWQHLANEAATGGSSSSSSLLTLDVDNFGSGLMALGAADERTADLRGTMKQDGYVHLNDWWTSPRESEGDPISTQNVQVLVKNLAYLMEHMDKELHLPGRFVLMYDQTWHLVQSLAVHLEEVYGLKLAFNFMTFHVKPGQNGWDIHRDGNGYDYHISFQKQDPFRDLPTSTSIWLALTDASEDTSDMGFLPAHADVEYADLTHPTGEDNEMEFQEHYERVWARGSSAAIQVPVAAGNALVWSHRSLHWSSSSPKDAPRARLSIRFDMGHPLVFPPLLDHTDMFVPPPNEARLALICYLQVANHYESDQPSEETMLPAVLEILADETYMQHLTDHALSPHSPDTMARQFSRSLYRIYNDDELENADFIRRHIERIASYIVVIRGLKSTKFMRDVSFKGEKHRLWDALIKNDNFQWFQEMEGRTLSSSSRPRRIKRAKNHKLAWQRRRDMEAEEGETE